MSASGRFVALREGAEIAVIDVLGTAPRRVFSGGRDFAIAGTSLVVIDGGGLRVEPLDGARAPGTLAIAGKRVAPFWGRAATCVMVDDAIVALEPRVAIAGEARGFPQHGRAVLVVERALTMVTNGRGVPFAPAAAAAALDGGAVREAVPLFGGRAVALVVEQRAAAGGGEVVVVIQQGAIVHRVRLGAPRWRAFAPERGLLLVGTGDAAIVTIDLRMGRVAAHGLAPHDVAALAIDEDGRSIAFVGADGNASVMRLDALGPVEAPTLAPAGDAVEEVADDLALIAADAPTSTLVSPPPGWYVPAATTVADAETETPAPVAIPDLVPLALGAPATAAVATTPPDDGSRPFAEPADHLAALLDLVAARAGAAIAEAWHTGRISADATGHHPFEREVRALAGTSGDHAPAQLADAQALLAARADELGSRVRASLAAGQALPFVELGRAYALSPLALQILAAVLAPHARGEIARLYRILGNETLRPTCNDMVIAQLVGGLAGVPSDRVALELAAHAPLLRHGLVRRDPVSGGLDVDPVLLARLRGQVLTSRTAVLRRAERTLDELVIDRAIVVRLVRELADARPADAPVRIVVRGRRGSGRHALVAALAARIDRPIACIDASLVPVDELARELLRASLVRAIPVISNALPPSEAERETRLRVLQILQAHPGPLVLRAGPDGAVPLEPGFVEVSLPALSETARAGVFAAALRAAGIAADPTSLARRYRVGPGTIHAIVAEAGARLARTGGDPAAADPDDVVDTCARQHLATRIGATAQRVTRLAEWDQVSLPDDMLDSLRELIGRARHARTVFDDWGYDDRIATSRGLTALFYGPPGTGKTMVAGLVARELGLELYRVDLANVVSKWLGETEKHLGELFDAAEDGKIMLLFDEADSLFARRSEVKSSNDRYANLEVNYLLQRLDAFEGVAILTTNLDGSIDPAFKRRMSMRLLFSLPDEEQRARLWAAHVTSRIPTRGVLDFAALGRRFPLSGGYIRNSALRAAFLAAQDGSPLTHQHLERAVLLEYRELGKLADDGRMD